MHGCFGWCTVAIYTSIRCVYARSAAQNRCSGWNCRLFRKTRWVSNTQIRVYMLRVWKLQKLAELLGLFFTKLCSYISKVRTLHLWCTSTVMLWFIKKRHEHVVLMLRKSIDWYRWIYIDNDQIASVKDKSTLLFDSGSFVSLETQSRVTQGPSGTSCEQITKFESTFHTPLVCKKMCASLSCMRVKCES